MQLDLFDTSEYFGKATSLIIENHKDYVYGNIDYDKYYTPLEECQKLVDLCEKYFGDKITQYIEPSAGNGSFRESLKGTGRPFKMYDLIPEADDIQEADFLNNGIKELNVYRKGRCMIGNPPFGQGNMLFKEFYKKSIEIADYIAFIGPVGIYNNDHFYWQFETVYEEVLDENVKFSGIEVKCAIKILKRSKKERVQPTFEHNDFTLTYFSKEKRLGYTGNSKEESIEYYKEKLKDTKFDFGIVAFGNPIGKINDGDLYHVKYFLVNITTKRYDVRRFLEEVKWEDHFKFTTAGTISIWQVNKIWLQKRDEYKLFYN